MKIRGTVAALAALITLAAPLPARAAPQDEALARMVLTAHWQGEELQYTRDDPAAAILAYGRALTLDPDHLASLLGRAEALRKLDRHGAALTDLYRAIALGADWTGYLMRARSRQATGDTAGAIDDYRRVLAEYPAHGAARETLHALGALP